MDLMPPTGWTPAGLEAAKQGGLTEAEVHRVLDDLKQFRVLNAVDPSAFIHPTARVWHYAVVLAGVFVDANCSIGSHCEIGRGSVIGTGTRIGSMSFLPPNTIVGSNVFIGPSVTLCDDKHPFVHRATDAPYTPEPPVIEDGAVIGAGSVLLPAVHIGKGARIGAGSIVTRNVPAGTHWRGEPARIKTLSTASAEAWV